MPKERRTVDVASLNLKNASLPALGITLGIYDEGEFKGYLRVGRAYMTWTRAGKGNKAITKTWEQLQDWIENSK